MIVIPVGNYPNKSYSTTLGGQSVIIRMNWKLVDDEGFWALSMYDSYGDLITGGRIVKPTINCLPSFLPRFTGRIIPIAISRPEKKLGVGSWGTDYYLTYEDD